jgi:hypothetical protein
VWPRRSLFEELSAFFRAITLDDHAALSAASPSPRIATARATSVPGGDTQVTRINGVTFTSYHRFGSTSRILPASPTPDTLP